MVGYMGINVNKVSRSVVNVVLILSGVLVFRGLGFNLKLGMNRPILDLYSFMEQHILVIYCFLLILQV